MRNSRVRVVIFTVIAVVLVILGRLFYMQVVDDEYEKYANNNVLRYQVQYPARGEVFDRHGDLLIESREVYDLIVMPRDVEPFDTTLISNIVGVDRDFFVRELKKAYAYSRRRPSVLFKQLPREIKFKLDEQNFPGFYTQFRTIRSYPRKMAGNLLGEVGEISPNELERKPYYRSGDYIGLSGIEQAYEETLRGQKGVKIEMVDAHGMPKGSYADGMFDTIPKPGLSITCTIDAKLQALAERLLNGKVGSVVAIEPETGEILVMASSPTYDPDELVGRQRGNNYMKLLNNPRRPLYNRAVKSPYPPGSTFKLVNALIALEEGTLVKENAYPCSGGYHVGRGVKCHIHASPVDLTGAIQTSCNAYFCYVYRNLVDSKKYGGVKKGVDVWSEYVRSFGFGRKLDSDFTNELDGNVPTSAYYDKKYNGAWNSLTNISLAIGQGEMGATPLQMANFVATVANRGYYHIPHVVKAIQGQDSIDHRFYEKHLSKVSEKHFNTVADAMWRAVNVGGTATGARVDGYDVCGKTGTAQNPHGADHSVFACFAPLHNPKIALMVYIENGGFGATLAVPIARMLMEQYLTGNVKDPGAVAAMEAIEINYPIYGK